MNTQDPDNSSNLERQETLEPVETAPIEPTTSLPPTTLAHPATTSTATAITNSRAPPSVRIRRLPSAPRVLTTEEDARNNATSRSSPEPSGRKRSFSAPQRPQHPPQVTNSLQRQTTVNAAGLSSLTEEHSDQVSRQHSHLAPPSQQDVRSTSPITGRLRASSIARSLRSGAGGSSRRSSVNAYKSDTAHDYENDVVDLLDVVDPEVSTLTTLNNVQNSLFIPYLGRWANRQPTYELSRRPTEALPLEEQPTSLTRTQTTAAQPTQTQQPLSAAQSRVQNELTQSTTISSVLNDSRYAVLPHGAVLEGWSDEDKEELNDHVRHLLHSKRAGFKRRMVAFGKYVRRPLGFFVTLYAFLITFWGTAWVLFLIGWISVGNRQAYFVEIADQVLTALFAVVGIGLAPFRTVDTYHMIFIAHYHRLTWRLRRERGLPDLEDPNDLPTATTTTTPPTTPKNDPSSLEKTPTSPPTSVLTPAQQASLDHHTAAFSKSHTFYKPHATFTHHAFHISFLIAVVVLLDCHSLFQIALGSTTWGINYHHRPKALTAAILACSISCNISGGICISIGDKKTRKKRVVEQLFRQGLTEKALGELERERGLQWAKRQEVSRVEERERLEKGIETEKRRESRWWRRRGKHERREERLRGELDRVERKEEV